MGQFLAIKAEAVKLEIELSGINVSPDDWKRFKSISRYAARELNHS